MEHTTASAKKNRSRAFGMAAYFGQIQAKQALLASGHPYKPTSFIREEANVREKRH